MVDHALLSDVIVILSLVMRTQATPLIMFMIMAERDRPGPLFFYFLVYGFLGSKNGSVGRKKIKNNFFSKGSIMSSCRKKLPVHEIVIKSDVLRNY